MLVLVNQDGLIRFDEPGRIGAHRCPGGQVMLPTYRYRSAIPPVIFRCALGYIERRYAMARAYLDSPPIRLLDAA